MIGVRVRIFFFLFGSTMYPRLYLYMHIYIPVNTRVNCMMIYIYIIYGIWSWWLFTDSRPQNSAVNWLARWGRFLLYVATYIRHTTSEAMSPPNRVTHTHHSTATHRKSRSNTPNHWPPLRTHKHIYIYLHITIIIFIERASFIFYRSIYNNGNLGLVVWWSE